MRPLTEYEKTQIATGFTDEVLPTQAVSIEFEFRYKDGLSPETNIDLFWEDVVFPAEFDGTNLKLNKIYIENPIYFSSLDSPEKYRDEDATSPYYHMVSAVTGKTFDFIGIANDTVKWNHESDIIYYGGGANPAAYHQKYHDIVTPAQVWARRIKIYTFDADGKLTSIAYKVFKEEVVMVNSGTLSYGQSKVVVSKVGDNYLFPLSSNTYNGATALWSPPAYPGAPTTVAAASVLPLGESGEQFNLLANAAEAKEYYRQVTLVGGLDTEDVYADRQRARENLAEALWG